MKYLAAFALAFGFGIIFTLLVRRLALKLNIIDWPKARKSKIHKNPTPLLGGLAVFSAFLVVVLIETFFTPNLLGGFLLPKHLLVILVGGGILVIGGFLDDKYNFKPYKSIIFPIVSALVIIIGGIGIEYITNPFGSALSLEQIKLTLFSIEGIPYQIILFADLFALVWILGMSYTTKFLDGLDGLVAGITTIGAFIIFILSLTKDVAQPETAILAIILAGAMLGYLIFAWHPARIFFGEGGSLFCGFMLGTLAILAGSKIATALLILGIPILDVIWVIIRRVLQKRSPFMADKKHLHFRLLDVGLSHRQSVLFLYALTLSFGLCALFLQGKEKLITLLVLAGVMIVLAIILVIVYKRKKSTVNGLTEND